MIAAVVMAALSGAPYPVFEAPSTSSNAAIESQGVDQWSDAIAVASRRVGVPAAWIRGVMRMESGGRTVFHGQPITSPAGAMGLMQLMPMTWETLRRRYRLGEDPYRSEDNILAGAAYPKDLYRRYGYPALFAAYNAGPRRLDQTLLRNRPLPAETRAYLSKLIGPTAAGRREALTPERSPLFFSLTGVELKTTLTFNSAR